jgi:hypothetical protein
MAHAMNLFGSFAGGETGGSNDGKLPGGFYRGAVLFYLSELGGFPGNLRRAEPGECVLNGATPR